MADATVEMMNAIASATRLWDEINAWRGRTNTMYFDFVPDSVREAVDDLETHLAIMDEERTSLEDDHEDRLHDLERDMVFVNPGGAVAARWRPAPAEAQTQPAEGRSTPADAGDPDLKTEVREG